MTILAWHFVGDTLRDGRPIPADGKTLVHDAALIPCESGLHASRRIIDALQYAPGNIVCRVQCAGDTKEQADKLVCRERTILWRYDAEHTLWVFARKCALDVVDLWDAPNVVRQYLETGDKTIKDAAKDAARDDAWDDAWDAAKDAAGAAARAAARAAAWAAARAAAWDAARAAARAAAWDAAWAAAWDAARGAQSDIIRGYFPECPTIKPSLLRKAA